MVLTAVPNDIIVAVEDDKVPVVQHFCLGRLVLSSVPCVCLAAPSHVASDVLEDEVVNRKKVPLQSCITLRYNLVYRTEAQMQIGY